MMSLSNERIRYMKKTFALFLTAFMLLVLSTSCSGTGVKQYKVSVLKEYPHDVTSYTQGLFFNDGVMYESTGLEGLSTFRKVDISTGKPLKMISFDRQYFIEGSVMLGGQLFILTWQNKVAFTYDAASWTYKSTVYYPREGWGLTTDGKHLIASDGTPYIYFMDKDFKLIRSIKVTMDGRAVRLLNELEYIDGKIWANVYTTDTILIINPSDGKVEGVIDCTGLLPDNLRDENTDVLNGIAYNPADRKIYLTGKNWKRLYEVKLVEVKK
jgi:glutamine cyclotransferase